MGLARIKLLSVDLCVMTCIKALRSYLELKFVSECILSEYIYVYICVCVYIYIYMKEMATHSSIFAWEIPWTKEPCGVYGVAKELDMT